MQRIQTLIKRLGINAEYSVPQVQTVNTMLKEASIRWGEQAKLFYGTYSRISYAGVEFVGFGTNFSKGEGLYGLNMSFKHWFRLPHEYYAIEQLKDGHFVICDSHDNVYDFVATDNARPEPKHIKLIDYICERLIEADRLAKEQGALSDKGIPSRGETAVDKASRGSKLFLEANGYIDGQKKKKRGDV